MPNKRGGRGGGQNKGRVEDFFKIQYTEGGGVVKINGEGGGGAEFQKIR